MSTGTLLDKFVTCTLAPGHDPANLVSRGDILPAVSAVGLFGYNVRNDAYFKKAKQAGLFQECAAFGVQVHVEDGVLKEFDCTGQDMIDKFEATAQRLDGILDVLRWDEPLNMLRHPDNLWVSKEYGGGGDPAHGHAGCADTPEELGEKLLPMQRKLREYGIGSNHLEAWPWADFETVMRPFLESAWREEVPWAFTLDVNLVRLRDDAPNTKSGKAEQRYYEEMARQFNAIRTYVLNRNSLFGIILGGGGDPMHGHTDAGWWDSGIDHMRYARDTIGDLPSVCDVESWGFQPYGQPHQFDQPSPKTVMDLAGFTAGMTAEGLATL